MGRLFEELKRRNVARVGVAYLVIAWLLLQVADTMVSALAMPEWVSPLIVLLLVIGLVPTLVFSWVFEMTADGIVRTSDVDAGRSISSVTGRKLDYVTIAAVIIAVAFLAWTNYAGDPAEPVVTVTDASVAVLPFANMSGHEDNEYFSDGLTETLLHVLAQIPELRVSARTSSFAFKNKDMDIREIARQLGVAHVLEGSVQRVGDRVRITAQLIRATDGTHLWSAKYDRTLDNIFAIHDEIASSVGAALTDSLLGDGGAAIPEGIATQNIEAFDLYLRALPEYAKGSFESFQNAEEFLKNALVKDPDFTDAKILLAENYIALGDTGARPMDEAVANAITLFEQALIDQPSNITAQSYLLYINTMNAVQSGDFAARPAAIESLGKLVNQAPSNYIARLLLGNILRSTSRPEEALVHLQKAISNDPLNPHPYQLIAQIYIALRDWDAAHEQISRSLEIEPQQPNALAVSARIFRATGDAVGYIQQVQKATAIDPLDFEQPYDIARLLYELELIDKGDQYGSQVVAIAPNSPAAQALKIIRSIRADSEAESLAVARQLIRDDADDRQGAWIRAFRHLMLTAVLRDRTQDEFEFIIEYVPNFAARDTPQAEWKFGVARAQTLEIWRDLDSEQGVLDRVDHTVQSFAALDLPLSRVQFVHIDVLLLRGDLEGAIDAALTNLFSHSVLDHLSIKDRFVTPLYADFVADPRITSALQKWDDELAQAREDVRQYLAAAE